MLWEAWDGPQFQSTWLNYLLASWIWHLGQIQIEANWAHYTNLHPTPDIIYFELGTNDLDSSLTPHQAAYTALEVADTLICSGIKQVIIGEALHRGQARELRIHQYNKKVDTYN